MTTVTGAGPDQMERIDHLRRVKAACRGLSIEPLWEQIPTRNLNLKGIDWVIVGGESGSGDTTRPFAVEWAEELRDHCKKQGVAGFDTESKPTFNAGEKSSGPHVVQFALQDRAFIFQLHRPECRALVSDWLQSERVLKVGFGLRNDRGQIRARLGVTLRAILDLDHVFRKRGYKGQIGVRAAIGAVLRQSFRKSRRVTTSNWAAAELTPAQLLYAANDAFAALRVMEALGLNGHSSDTLRE